MVSPFLFVEKNGHCLLLTSCLEVGNSGSNLYKTSCTVNVVWMLLRVSISLNVLIFDRQIGLSYSCCVTHIAKIYLVRSGINHCLHWRNFVKVFL